LGQNLTSANSCFHAAIGISTAAPLVSNCADRRAAHGWDRRSLRTFLARPAARRRLLGAAGTPRRRARAPQRPGMAHAAPAPGDRALHRPARHALRRASRATGQLGGPRRPAPLGKTPRRARRRNARRGKPATRACSSAPGRPYFCAAPPGAHLRLSFAAVEQVGEIREAVQRLARVLAAQPPRSPRGRPAASAR